MSLVVSFLLLPVAFASPGHDTDAQNTAELLLGVVTRPCNESHGVQVAALWREISECQRPQKEKILCTLAWLYPL